MEFLHSCQGKSSERSLIKEMCDLLNISKSRTTLYHAMGNGQCERFNRTLLDYVRHSKKRYDTKVSGAALKVGDHVRKTYLEQGRHKIDNKWEK